MDLLLQSSLQRTKVPAMILICLFVLQNTSFATNAARMIATEQSLNARINVTGTVKDSKGEVLPGVTVKIKGTNSGTSTDINGVFRLNLPKGNETLVFTYIGFQTKEVVASGTNMDIQLIESANDLQEVVVVGYGIQKREHLTGAVESIKVDEVADLPVGNLGAALSGRILGLGVSGGTSRPGSTASLTIRNPVTLAKDGGNLEPLYVIDDIIQIGADGRNSNALFNNLDPTEIESISVLKDGSAAVYGSRAANGVILVRTKRGKNGDPKFSYSGSYAINDESYRTKMMSAYEFGQYFNIMNGPNGSNAPKNTTYRDRVFSQDELDHFRNINYDWLDEAWSAASNMRHTLNVSGGTEKATYFAGMTYFTQDGNLSSLDYDRWNFRAGTDVKIGKNIKSGIQVSGNYSNLTKTFNKIGGENDDNDYVNLLRAPRYIPMYVDGYPVKLPSSNDAFSRYHFFEIEKLGNLAETKDRTMTVNLFAEYDVPFVQGLKARASYGRNIGSNNGSQVGTLLRLYEFNRTGDHQHIYDQGATVNSYRDWENGNRLYYSNSNSNSYQLNLTASYARDFGKHSVGGLFSIEKAEAESDQEDVWKGSPSLTTNGQFGSAFGAIDGRTSALESGSLSYVGRVNYAYDDKYLAEFLFRSDASTKFAPENYWGKFFSASAGWILSKEDFFNVDAIDFLKLRYSIGLLGKDDTKAWLWRQRYTYQNGKGAVFGSDTSPSSTGMKMEASPNRDATWSDELKNNFGIDARFLNDRLSANVDAFYNKGTNMLIERTGVVPITIGGSVASENFAAVDLFGYEIGLGWRDKIGKDFNYGIDARFNWYDNKVHKGNFNDTDIMYPWNPQPGKSSDNGVWGYDYLGMFKTQADIDAYVTENNITQVFETPVSQLRPGTLYYRDVRGPLQADGTFAAPDGIIDFHDQIKLKNRKNNHYGMGFTLRASYKGFSADVVISGSFGGWSEIDGSARKKLNNDITRGYQSLPAIWGNIYDPEINPDGTMPNPNFDKISLDPLSSFWEVNSFRMRMRNFNVGYSLPKKFTQAVNVNNARVFVTGTNPLNFYNPFDYRDSDTAWDSFPNLRTFSFGVNVSL
ncbi:SusC/RagA family TonB-linked outer membrane protein [Arcticibacter sp.]|jgi:TonB-linked SusC/RagA family outer membrane protein|uniref:SusC/RagA family TonB-linked outer membrane protein n=1 Tax=Arcticibacter sp. TaxID=1872630 RepID=UPI00388D06A8